MTKAVPALVAAVVLVALVPAARAASGQSDELAAAPRISQAEFRKALASGAVLVLDVRDAASYANGHIPGARSMPLDELGSHTDELKAEQRPIVTYCA